LFAVPVRDVFSCRVIRLHGLLAGILFGRGRGGLLGLLCGILFFSFRSGSLHLMPSRQLLFGNWGQILLRLPNRLVIGGRCEELFEVRDDTPESCHYRQPGLYRSRHPGDSLCRRQHKFPVTWAIEMSAQFSRQVHVDELELSVAVAPQLQRDVYFLLYLCAHNSVHAAGGRSGEMQDA
jgi:hypothetical protein